MIKKIRAARPTFGPSGRRPQYLECYFQWAFYKEKAFKCEPDLSDIQIIPLYNIQFLIDQESELWDK